MTPLVPPGHAVKAAHLHARHREDLAGDASKKKVCEYKALKEERVSICGGYWRKIP
jgi:hypothetical protein